jgi:hypothetical protein
MFGILDNNNNGVIDIGDVSNTDSNGANTVQVSGPTSQDINLPSTGSVVSLTTSHQQWQNNGVSNDNYGLNFDLRAGIKLPVAMEVVSGPGLLEPTDIANYQANRRGGEFQFWQNINATPKVNDTYGLKVWYSDGTSETVSPTITTVLDSSAFAQNLAIVRGPSPVTPETPTFTWSAPANPPSGGYTYQFWLGGQNGQIWQVPGNNSKSRGLDSSTASLPWGYDPSNMPSVPSLTDGTQYQWNVTVQDNKGNSAQVQVSYTPTP